MSLRIGTRQVGVGYPCVVVAEIGINHNGELPLARELVAAAAAAGADAVKFQNYRTEDFVRDRSLSYSYESQGRTVVESQYDLFKRCELDVDQLAELRACADRHGVEFQSTPTSEQGVRDLLGIGAKSLKNGSDYLGHLPLIAAMGRTGLPTVVSTGMATLAEIDDAVRTFRSTGNDQLVLLHCTSAYPTPPADLNLRRLRTLSAAFGCPVGFSDHSDGTAAAIGAVAVGACWVEKHFTLDRALPGPDHRFSSDPDEFSRLVRDLRTVEAALGSESVGPAPAELEARQRYRLSCVAATDLAEGHVLSELDVAFARPGGGVAPRDLPVLSGRRLKRRVAAGALIVFEDVV